MPFYSWDWFYHSWIHFAKPDGQELFVVAVYDENKLIGILPLVRRMRKSSGISYRLLSFCNVGMMPRNTLYSDSHHEPETVYHAAWNHLFANRPHWDMLELANIPDTSPFHKFILDSDHAKGYALIQNKGFIAPYIELTGTLEDYLKSLSKGTRKDLRKHVEHFEKSDSSHSVRFYEKPEEIAEGLKHLDTVHSNSWKGDYSSAHFPQFYQEVTPLLATRGEVKVVIAFLDDVPIGAGYMLCKNGVYYGCIRDYDQKYKEYAPGILLLDYQLEHLLHEGGKIFDFCGTSYDHKEKFGTGHNNHSTFQICHSGLKSRLVYSAKTFWLPLFRKMMRKPADTDLILTKKG
jgi:CelD/BcsL family acetyltransferase involved in cellulose biosynthesis